MDAAIDDHRGVYRVSRTVTACQDEEVAALRWVKPEHAAQAIYQDTVCSCLDARSL
jgi:hypothetical protein